MKKALFLVLFILGMGAFTPSFASTSHFQFDNRYGEAYKYYGTITDTAGGFDVSYTGCANESVQWTVGVSDQYVQTGSDPVVNTTSFYHDDGPKTLFTGGGSWTSFAYNKYTFTCNGTPIHFHADVGDKVRMYGTGNYFAYDADYSSNNDMPDAYHTVEATEEPATIDLLFPQNGQSYADDFSHWKIGLSTGSTGFSGYWGVRYGASTSTMTTSDDTHLFGGSFVGGATSTKYIPKSTPSNGYTYAQAFIANVAGTDIAVSDIISFGANGYTSPTRYTGAPLGGSDGAPVSTSTALVITCDDTDGLFANSLCKLGVYFFKPSDDVFNNYNSLWAMISAKPPLGYFTKSKEALETLNNSTSTAFTFEDVSELGDSVFTPLRTGIAFLLWFMFGIWIFNRFRHLQF